MRFIELTLAGGRPLLLNARLITAVQDYGSQTYINFGESGVTVVQESLAEVRALLSEFSDAIVNRTPPDAAGAPS